MKLDELITGLVVAMCAILQTFFATALPDFTSLAISDQLSSLGLTSVTIDVFRLKIEAELFSIQVSRFFSGNIVVILGGNERGTVGTDKAAIRSHF